MKKISFISEDDKMIAKIHINTHQSKLSIGKKMYLPEAYEFLLCVSDWRNLQPDILHLQHRQHHRMDTVQCTPFFVLPRQWMASPQTNPELEWLLHPEKNVLKNIFLNVLQYKNLEQVIYYIISHLIINKHI